MLNQVKYQNPLQQISAHIWSFLIGMSCGMPFILTSSTLKVWMSEADVPIVFISCMNFLNVSYLLKFTWAPIFDHHHPPGLSHHKSWIIYTHIATACSLLALSYCSPQVNLTKFVLFAAITAFMGANATLSLDGYWIRFIDKRNVQEFAGVTEVGYRLGKIITGGVALIIAEHFQWKTLYQVASFFFIFITCLLLFLPEIESKPKTNQNVNHILLIKECWHSLISYGGILLIFFLMTVKINEGLEHSLLPLFMLRKLSTSLSAVGVITKVIGIIANLIGLMIAIICIKKWGYKQTLQQAIYLHLMSTVALSTIAIYGFLRIEEIVLVCLFDNVARGLISTTLLSFYADKISGSKSATQFSLYALITGCSGILFAPIGGLIVDNLDWSALFIFSAIATLPSLLALNRLNDNLIYTPSNKAKLNLFSKTSKTTA